VQPGQSCWREARTSMLATQLDPVEQRDRLCDSGAYDSEADDEVAAS